MTTVSDPIAILNLPENSLRSQGLSSRKIEYVNALAEAFVTGFISDERLRKSTDLEVIQHLTQIRGIGRWTSEMFLIFHLTRPNIFPWDDIGLHKGLIKNYRLRKPVTQRHHDRFKKIFSPWCTVAVWYLWRDLDPAPVHY